MTDDEILTTALRTLETAREEYVITGEVTGVFYIIAKAGVTALVPWGISKDMTADVLRHQCKERKARGIFHVFEAWAVFGEELPPDVQPSQHPKAKEYIIGLLQDVRLGIRIWTSEVHDDRKARRADDIVEVTDPHGNLPDGMGGRFSDLLCADEWAS